MPRLVFSTCFLGLTIAAPSAAAQQKPVAHQVAEAVSPLPEPLRDGATVRSFANDGTLVTIRAGTNMMICLADDPMREGFHAACYHRDLEPFMTRGRELRAEGKSGDDSRDIRFAEAESGKLQMPSHPTALYSLTDPNGTFDYETGRADGATGLHVVYVPYATEETLGISTIPSRDRPWLMHPGTPGAHIMIIRR